MAEVTLKDVKKIYRSNEEPEGVLAVDDLNLEIHDGELLCLLGPSGCGKTTTLRMIVGLETITNGDIYIGDKLVNSLTPQERNVAMSFETYALYTHLSVKENLLFPLRAKGFDKNKQKERLGKVVEMLNIGDILDRSPSNLSGGQQQRVSLGRALIREPDVFLLDEPLSHLDVSLRITTRTRIKRLHSQLNTTMIYVTHDQLEAIALADRIAVMNFAELQQVGTREELLNKPKNMFVADFIGEPPINFLECSLHREKEELFLKLKKFDYRISLPKEWQNYLDKLEILDLVLGIRPYDLHFKKEEGDIKVGDAEVEIFEFLGEENHVTVNFKGKNITVVTKVKNTFEVGEQVEIYVAPERLHLFNKSSEECLSTEYKNEIRG